MSAPALDLSVVSAAPAAGAAPDLLTTTPTGLTEAEASARRAQGLGNTGGPRTGRSYADIVRDNLFTFINVSLFAVGAVLISMGLVRDAIMASGLAVANGLIGVVQEVIAKRRLDKIALVNRTNATVVRDGEHRSIPPEQIVAGDLLAVAAGDQVFVDGRLIEGALQADESLLTGESDPMPRQAGDPVAAGSFCVSGSGLYFAEKVGAESLAARIAAGAKAYRTALTPLQRGVNRVVRLLLAVAGFFLVSIIISSLLHDYPFRDTVLAAAVVLGIVPSGLFLMIVVTYSMAIVRLARQDALVQQVNAVESLSNVTVFCMDKTGTLTANALKLVEIRPIGGAAEADLRRDLGAFARSAPGGTKTSDAIAAACPAAAHELVDSVPFSSARKWSAAAAAADAFRGTFALGAPEFLGKLVTGGDSLVAPAGWAEAGRRILLWARSPEAGPLHDAAGEPHLPTAMEAAAWLAFDDELRPHSRDTLQAFRHAGIELKIISGDNPETVAALARQAGLPADAKLVAGPDLEAMDDAAFGQAAREATVFGRVTPEQKRRLVETLKRQGQYVAMTGDGVNDVLSLKQADLGIAMQSGSQATRNAADIVLLHDSFSALPLAFAEGQRIRRGLQGVLELFLTRVFTVALVILAVLVVEAGFPFSPAHLTLLTTLTVGIPTFGLALWAHGGPPPAHMGKALVRFVLPASLLLSAFAFAVYLLMFVTMRLVVEHADDGGVIATATLAQAETAPREALIHVLVLGGLILVPFAAPPTRWFAVVKECTGDWRPTLLALAMLPLYILVLAVPALRGVFGLNLLDPEDYLIVAGLVVAWALLLRRAWQRNTFGRFFGYSDDEPTITQAAAAPTPEGTVR
jgi:cation-transporting ATPase E